MEQEPLSRSKKILGYLALIGASIAFSITVIFAKQISSLNHIPGTEIAFFRFLTGFTILVIIQLFFKIDIQPSKISNLIERGVSHALAVLIFFVSISVMSAIKANLFNMTYTIYIGILAPILIGEKTGKKGIISIILGIIGVFILINPSSISILGITDIIGVLSGFTSGYAMVTLTKARRTEHTFTILYYIMGIGTALTAIPLFFNGVTPTYPELFLLIIVGLLTLIGQYTMTYGYKYVSSLEGAVILNTQIFIVPILSIIFLGEQLSLNIILAAVMVFASIIVLNR